MTTLKNVCITPIRLFVGTQMFSTCCVSIINLRAIFRWFRSDIWKTKMTLAQTFEFGILCGKRTWQHRTRISGCRVKNQRTRPHQTSPPFGRCDPTTATAVTGRDGAPPPCRFCHRNARRDEASTPSALPSLAPPLSERPWGPLAYLSFAGPDFRPGVHDLTWSRRPAPSRPHARRRCPGLVHRTECPQRSTPSINEARLAAGRIRSTDSKNTTRPDRCTAN